MSIDLKNLEIETQLVQSLEEFEEGESRTVPLVQSTTFNYTNPDTLAELFDLKKLGYFYSRLSNPTVAAFENKMAILEKGVGALAFASGQAAITAAILTICKAGDHIVAVSTLYGGTITLLASTLKNYGIETTFLNPEASEEEFKAAFRENTKILYGETLGNPEMNTLDFEKFVKIAKEKDVPTIVDNTLASPYLCTPISYGINIVVHSATKYIDGQGSVLGGVIIDGGNYNWDNGKFPMLVEPDVSYHNMSYYKTFGNLAYIIKARANILRDMGAALSPFNAFILLRGLETLHLRMERHSENALALATALEKNPNITWVKYSKLPSHYSYKNAEKYLTKGGSGVILVGVKGGREGAEKFIKGLGWIRAVVHVGDSRTCLLHPASTTHRQLSEEDLIKCGVLPEAVRINVGIENINDIIADIEQALAKI